MLAFRLRRRRRLSGERGALLVRHGRRWDRAPWSRTQENGM
uniref:Uncharacterized protein n=1 Tax=Arundo donax TaxID=35708 RepID=A0A0A9ETP0_ARUDO